MDDIRHPPDRRLVHFLFLAVSVVAMVYGWRWAALEEQTDPSRAYWIRFAATALPAIAAWGSSIRIRALRTNGHAASVEQAFDVLRWLALGALVVVGIVTR